MPRPSLLTVLRVVVVIACAIGGTTLLPRLDDGATADLVLLVVVAGAVMRGAPAGALLGLGAGWVVDLVPPGGDPLGAAALSYAAAGALAGAARRFGTWSPLLPVLATVAGAVVVQGAGLLVAAATADPLLVGRAAWTVALTTAVGLFVVPLLLGVERALVRRRLG
jgi:rod shape-determining protein MreD